MSRRRSDSRQANDIRELALNTSLLSRADGSAKFGCGPVTVLASISGPIEVRLRDEVADRATLEVNLRPLTGLPGPASKSLANSLSYLLTSQIYLNKHPRSLIQLSLQTLELPSTKFSKPFKTFSEVIGSNDDEDEDETDNDAFGDQDGSRESVVEKACAINAAVCALMDAAIDMRGMIAAVGVAILPEPQPGTREGEEAMQDDGDAGQASRIHLDPSAEEERDAACTICVGFSFGETMGGTEGDVCFLETSKGSCEEGELLQAIDSARRAAQSTLAFVRKSQEARYLAK